MAAFDVQITSSFDEAEAVWRELEGTGDAFVFQTFDWQLTWYRVVGRGKGVRPCIAIVRAADDGRAVMLLPLGIVRRGLGRALIWLGGDLADYNGPVLAPRVADDLAADDVERLWRQICSALPAFDYVDFRRQPVEIGDQRNPFQPLCNRADPIPGCSTRLEPSWSVYHAAKRSAETRRKERRKEGKLGKHGPVDFVIARTEAEIERIVAAMVAQKAASYERKGVRNLFRDQAYVDFIKAFTRAHAAGEAAVLAAIEVEGEVVAAQWGVVRDGRFYCLVHAHDQGRFARYSPGNILLRRVLEWSCENGIAVFDFTYGEESYKDHWCECRLDLYDSLLARTPLGLAAVLGLRCRDGLRRAVKRSDQLRALANGVRRRWYAMLPRRGTRHTGAARETAPDVDGDWSEA